MDPYRDIDDNVKKPNHTTMLEIAQKTDSSSRVVDLIHLAKGDLKALRYIREFIRDKQHKIDGATGLMAMLALTINTLDIVSHSGNNRTQDLIDLSGNNPKKLKLITSIVKNHAKEFFQSITGVNIIVNNLSQKQ